MNPPAFQPLQRRGLLTLMASAPLWASGCAALADGRAAQPPQQAAAQQRGAPRAGPEKAGDVCHVVTVGAWGAQHRLRQPPSMDASSRVLEAPTLN